MKKINIRIGQKIIGGFSILVIIFIFNGALSLFTLSKSDSIIQESAQVINPSREALNDLNLMIINSKMYITNWVFLPSNTADKEALKRLHETEFPQLEKKIKTAMKSWKDKDQVAKMDSILKTFNALLKLEKTEIMQQLVTFENYEDISIKFMASDNIDAHVLPKSAWLINKVQEVLENKKAETKASEANLITSFNRLQMVTVVMGVILILIGMVSAFFITRSITNPINFIKSIILQLGKGELPQERQRKYNGDEVGEMALAVDNLVDGLRSTSLFAENIGKGVYDADFSPLSEKDVLGNALIEMRNNLQKVAEDDQKRNWATEGLAIFGEILRKNNDNIARLSDEIICNLVKYLKANQGGLYIVNEEDSQEPYLYLAACYAWDKKKYLEQKIYMGDGLTGQSWQEQDAIYLTEVPDDYISITSGLGEANPKSILIMPLKINEMVYGIVEIASFGEFQLHEREFVERIAESIASTISTVKTNERTQKLLEESTQMTEQMRAQEEEMRQNMEELQATQEEMQRAQRDAQAREDIFNTTQCILETDSRFNIIYTNSLVQKHLKYSSDDLLGSSLSSIFGEADQYTKARAVTAEGKNWTGMLHLKNKLGEKVLFKASLAPIQDHHRNVTKYLILLDDLSELQLA